MRARHCTLASGVLLVATLLALTCAGATAQQLTSLNGFYPRVVALQASNSTSTLLAATQDGQRGYIWRSENAGASFSQHSIIEAGAGAQSLCCIALFEFPVALGAFPAGTLLWSASVLLVAGSLRTLELRVWRSADGGATWARTTSVAISERNIGGVWEPHFHVDAYGALRCTYSDSSDQQVYSQLLQQKVSHDGGITWSSPEPVVAYTQQPARPGMATVVSAPNGNGTGRVYYMSYEVCSELPQCAVHIRSSPDGADWGTVTDLGVAVLESSDGSYLAHTPWLSWAPVAGTPGLLLLTGMMYFNKDNSTSPGNGGTMLVAKLSDPPIPLTHFTWSAQPTPLRYRNATEGKCINYSSPLLPLGEDGALLELASNYNATGECDTFFATGRV